MAREGRGNGIYPSWSHLWSCSRLNHSRRHAQLVGMPGTAKPPAGVAHDGTARNPQSGPTYPMPQSQSPVAALQVPWAPQPPALQGAPTHGAVSASLWSSHARRATGHTCADGAGVWSGAGGG